MTPPQENVAVHHPARGRDVPAPAPRPRQAVPRPRGAERGGQAEEEGEEDQVQVLPRLHHRGAQAGGGELWGD